MAMFISTHVYNTFLDLKLKQPRSGTPRDAKTSSCRYLDIEGDELFSVVFFPRVAGEEDGCFRNFDRYDKKNAARSRLNLCKTQGPVYLTSILGFRLNKPWLKTGFEPETFIGKLSGVCSSRRLLREPRGEAVWMTLGWAYEVKTPIRPY